MVKSLHKLEPTPLLSQRAKEAIKEYILANNFKAGDALPSEVELVQQLGISRNSVREAVRELVALQIIEVRRGDGLYVGKFSLQTLLESISYGAAMELDELKDYTEVRCVLEVGMIETAIQQMSDERIATLREIIERMGSRSEQDEDFSNEDRLFHSTIFSHLDNNVLLTLLDAFWVAFNKASRLADLKDQNKQKTYQDHVAILDAVEARDIPRAQQALEQHYAGLIQRLTRAREQS